MKYSELITETEAALTELENKQKLVQFQKRIRFLCLLKDGTAKTQKQAGEMVGWKLRQAQKVWALYRANGIKSVLQRNARWQTGKLSVAQREQLSGHLAATGGGESLAGVQDYIQSAFGVSYSIGGISDLCQRLKIKLKTARPVNLKKDEEKVFTYKKTLAA